MATTQTAPLRYAPMIQALHWSIAVLVFVQLGLGKLGEVEPGEEGSRFALHAALGVLVLALMLVRIGWRATHTVPAEPPGTTRGQALFAGALVVAFYALLLVLPMSGWTLASLEGEVVSVFGFFDLPVLPLTGGEETEKLVEEVHELAGNVMLALIALHVAAALKHHFIAKNDVLMRMLPRHGSR
ncbi:MAG: cytochrome b [Gammaproteobacteria bacterium]|nr:cytochrome b [Gammaproteobacteria bacterium]